MHRFRTAFALSLTPFALLWSAAQAQTGAAAPPADATVALSAPDACKREYVKFEEAIGFLRRTQGNEAAAALKEKLLPARLQDEILLRDGYCGLARYLREKKLH